MLSNSSRQFYSQLQASNDSNINRIVSFQQQDSLVSKNSDQQIERLQSGCIEELLEKVEELERQSFQMENTYFKKIRQLKGRIEGEDIVAAELAGKIANLKSSLVDYNTDVSTARKMVDREKPKLIRPSKICQIDTFMRQKSGSHSRSNHHLKIFSRKKLPKESYNTQEGNSKHNNYQLIIPTPKYSQLEFRSASRKKQRLQTFKPPRTSRVNKASSRKTPENIEINDYKLGENSKEPKISPFSVSKHEFKKCHTTKYLRPKWK